jgi:hypothetical protein
MKKFMDLETSSPRSTERKVSITDSCDKEDNPQLAAGGENEYDLLRNV